MPRDWLRRATSAPPNTPSTSPPPGRCTKQAFLALTGGRQADVVFEATGRPSSIGEGLKVLRPDGILVATGIHAAPSALDVTRLVRNRQQIRGAHGSRPAGLGAHGATHRAAPEEVRPFVSLQLGLADALHGFECSKARDVSKMVLLPESGA